MNLNLIVSIGLILFLCGCGNSERESSYSLSELPTFLPESKEGSYDKSGLITIPYDFDESRDLEVEEWLEMEKVVLLSDEYLLGGIRKVLIWKDQFIIQDKSRETLVSYDFEGNLQWVFDRKGEGPKEYVQIRDFDVNYEHDRIDLFDARGRKIMHVSPETGELLGTTSNSSYAMEIRSLGDEFIAFHSQDLNPEYNQHLLVMNQKSEVKLSFLPFFPYDYFHSRRNSTTLSKYKSTVYINYFANDTLYTYDSGKLSAQFKFEIDGKPSIDYQILENSLEFNRALNENLFTFGLADDFFRIDDNFFFFLTSDDEKTIHYNFLETPDMEIRTFKFFDEDKFFTNHIRMTPSFLGVSEGYLIREIEPQFYQLYRNWFKQDALTEEGELVEEALKRDFPLVYQMATQTEDDSNLILVLYTLKK